jgi:hypothetical protein
LYSRSLSSRAFLRTCDRESTRRDRMHHSGIVKGNQAAAYTQFKGPSRGSVNAKVRESTQLPR